MFHYLQKSSKLLAKLGGLIYKLRLLLRFIMTRIMTNPELIKPGRRVPIAEKVWFCRTGHALPMNAGLVWVSSILRDGTIIDQVKIQARPVQLGDKLVVSANVALMNSKNPAPGELMFLPQLISWQESERVWSWYAYNEQVDETWELQKIVRGSDMRIGIAVRSQTVNAADIRVSVRYEA